MNFFLNAFLSWGAAVAVFGGGPASRETEAIAPERNHPLNALVFSDGSAYGLAASGGVARCLEEHGVGYDTGIARVPIVCQSCIYDLGYGSATVRPDWPAALIPSLPLLTETPSMPSPWGTSSSK